MEYPVPSNETERLRAVEAYDVFGTEAESGFDDLAELAAQIAETEIALVNIVGDTNIWIKARLGVPAELNDIPRGAVCCAHAVCQSDLLIIPDTLADDRLKELPFIATEPFVRFYAGMPLIDSGGYALGTLCVMDLEPRELSFEVTEALRRLARQAVAQLELRIKLAEVQLAQEEIANEKRRAEDLILNILPADIAKELAASGHVEPRHHTAVTIMFADFVGFTSLAEQSAPRALVDDLHRYFSAFDDIVRSHGLEKLKTVGDAYLCAGGLLGDSGAGHVAESCLAALDMQHFMVQANEERARRSQAPWQLRTGIHTGSVMSGVVGKDKFTYDIWGDTVNIAARLQTGSDPGRINVSESTYQTVRKYFDFEPRGSMEAKNKGAMAMYFLNGLKPEFSIDGDGRRASEKLSAAITGVSTKWVMPS